MLTWFPLWLPGADAIKKINGETYNIIIGFTINLSIFVVLYSILYKANNSYWPQARRTIVIAALQMILFSVL